MVCELPGVIVPLRPRLYFIDLDFSRRSAAIVVPSSAARPLYVSSEALKLRGVRFLTMFSVARRVRLSFLFLTRIHTYCEFLRSESAVVE